MGGVASVGTGALIGGFYFCRRSVLLRIARPRLQLRQEQERQGDGARRRPPPHPPASTTTTTTTTTTPLPAAAAAAAAAATAAPADGVEKGVAVAGHLHDAGAARTHHDVALEEFRQRNG